MKKIELTKEQIENICEAITEVYITYKKAKNVECIYFAPYTNYTAEYTYRNKIHKTKQNAIEITIVKNGNLTDEKEKYKKTFNRKHQTKKYIKENNTIIKVVLDDANYYSPFGLNPSERRRGKDLLNSHILLDRTKEYENIQKIVKKYNNAGEFSSYENAAEIIPPIDNELDRALEIKQCEFETEAVKEFTKAPLFDYIKDLK